MTMLFDFFKKKEVVETNKTTVKSVVAAPKKFEPKKAVAATTFKAGSGAAVSF